MASLIKHKNLFLMCTHKEIHPVPFGIAYEGSKFFSATLNTGYLISLRPVEIYYRDAFLALNRDNAKLIDSGCFALIDHCENGRVYHALKIMKYFLLVLWACFKLIHLV